jgi:hypothetical protein
MHGIPSRSKPDDISNRLEHDTITMFAAAVMPVSSSTITGDLGVISRPEHSADESDGPASRVSKMHGIPSRSEPGVIICKLEHSVDESDGPASRVSKMHCIPSRSEPSVIICRREHSVDKSNGPASRVSKMHGIPSTFAC